MSFNEELALAAVARIEADPEAWNQGTWYDEYKSQKLGRPVGCFALHVCLAAGLEMANLESGYFKATEASDALGLGRTERSINSIASKLLGVDEYGTREDRATDQAFEAGNSLGDIKRLINKAAGKALPEYRIAHRTTDDDYDDQANVTVVGKDAVRAFLANLDLDTLAQVYVRLIEN